MARAIIAACFMDRDFPECWFEDRGLQLEVLNHWSNHLGNSVKSIVIGVDSFIDCGNIYRVPLCQVVSLALG